jgi:hypothetical protein
MSTTLRTKKDNRSFQATCWGAIDELHSGFGALSWPMTVSAAAIFIRSLDSDACGDGTTIIDVCMSVLQYRAALKPCNRYNSDALFVQGYPSSLLRQYACLPVFNYKVSEGV